jgi:transposase-like protein
MAARLSSKRLPRYSLQFQRGAVRLTEMPRLEVQVVARALDIHPVTLSRCVKKLAKVGFGEWFLLASDRSPHQPVK